MKKKIRVNKKKKVKKKLELPTARIELTTSSLLVMRSTTEPCGLSNSSC